MVINEYLVNDLIDLDKWNQTIKDKIILNNDIGVIKMEVSRSVEPQDGYLNSIRKIADENNIILIFDEIVCGFRTNIGGAAKEYGVNADLGCFGKALANWGLLTNNSIPLASLDLLDFIESI